MSQSSTSWSWHVLGRRNSPIHEVSQNHKVLEFKRFWNVQKKLENVVLINYYSSFFKSLTCTCHLKPHWETWSEMVAPWKDSFENFLKLHQHFMGSYQLMGISSGLVFMTPGYQAWVCRFESPLGPQYSGLAWSLHKCAVLWRTVYGPSATDRPPWNYLLIEGNSSRYRVSIAVILPKEMKGT